MDVCGGCLCIFLGHVIRHKFSSIIIMHNECVYANENRMRYLLGRAHRTRPMKITRLLAYPM